MSIKLIDLFAGAGGLTLGFVDKHFCGGFECVLGVDNDPLVCDGDNNPFADIAYFWDFKIMIVECF